MNNPSELWMRRDHKHDYAFRPLEKALLNGTVDAIYNQMGQLGQLSEATGQIKAIFDLSKLPDWTIQVANTPAVITCTDVMANEHPELVVAYMKAMIKVGRWANRNKHAAAEILNRQTFYLDAEHTYRGIKDVDMVPSLSAQNLECVKIGKDFMFSHGYISADSTSTSGPAPSSSRRRPKRSSRRSGSAGAGASFPMAAGSRSRPSGSGSRIGAPDREGGGGRRPQACTARPSGPERHQVPVASVTALSPRPSGADLAQPRTGRKEPSMAMAYAMDTIIKVDETLCIESAST